MKDIFYPQTMRLRVIAVKEAYTYNFSGNVMKIKIISVF